jgi:hypothetical protein
MARHRSHSNSRRAVARFVALFAALLLGACTSAGNKPAFSVDELFSATVAGQPSLRFFPSRAADPAAAIGWSNAFLLPQISGGRLDLLALSAGGPDTAFSAGAYKGLNAAAQWPSYEIVTATSTAALLAPFVFVGGGNQAAVEDLLTGKTLSRLFVNPIYRFSRSGPPKSAGRAYASFIARTITPQLIARVAAEHARGRRLLIATANLDTSQLTVWNMGAIASLGLPGVDLFRNVIQAASALPGVLPPVQIDTQSGLRPIKEMHGDASILTHFYVDPRLLPDTLRNAAKLWPVGAVQPGIDILVNSKIDVDAKPIEHKAVAGAPGASVIRTSLKLLLNDTVREAAASGTALRYAFLPPEWRTVSQTDFDSGYQRDTFDFGFQRAISGTLWTQGEQN